MITQRISSLAMELDEGLHGMVEIINFALCVGNKDPINYPTKSFTYTFYGDNANIP